MMQSRIALIGAVVVTVIVGAVALFLVVGPMLEPERTLIQAIMARGLDEQYQPIEPAGTFAPDETFYLSVRIERPSANSIISAHWYYGARLVMTQDQVISAEAGLHYVGFELRRVDEPWPVGAYHVEILLNNAPVGAASFNVGSPDSPTF